MKLSFNSNIYLTVGRLGLGLSLTIFNLFNFFLESVRARYAQAFDYTTYFDITLQISQDKCI